MFKKIKLLAISLISLTFIISCSGVKTTATKDWETRVQKKDEINNLLSNLYVSESNQRALVLSPLFVESYSTISGNFLTGINIKKNSIFTNPLGANAPRYVDKVFIYIEEMDAVLEFDDNSISTISLHSMKNSKELWRSIKFDWSIKGYKEILDYVVAHSTKKASIKNRVSLSLSAGLFFPERYVNEITTILPDRKTMLLQGNSVLYYIDLNTGDIKWKVDKELGTISHLFIDEDNNDIIAIGGNPFWLPSFMSNIYNFNKKISRINLETGSIKWTSDYTNNIVAKTNGDFYDYEVFKLPNIFIQENLLVLDFNQIEIFDYETGKQLLNTESGKNNKFDLGGTLVGPPSSFAFPITDGNNIIRPSTEKIHIFGMSIGNSEPTNYVSVLESYNVRTGKLNWKSQELDRAKITNLDYFNNLVLLGTNRKSGVLSINSNDGKTVWNLELDKRGVTTPWFLDNNNLVFGSRSRFYVVNAENGNVVKLIDMSKEVGDIESIFYHNDRIIVKGIKKGIVALNSKTYEIENQIKTGYNGELFFNDKKFILSSIDPTEPLMIFDPVSFDIISSIKKSGNRSSLYWDINSNNIYELRGNKLTKYVY